MYQQPYLRAAQTRKTTGRRAATAIDPPYAAALEFPRALLFLAALGSTLTFKCRAVLLDSAEKGLLLLVVVAIGMLLVTKVAAGVLRLVKAVTLLTAKSAATRKVKKRFILLLLLSLLFVGWKVD